MTEPKRHIILGNLENYAENKDFSSKNSWSKNDIPAQDRIEHGNRLLSEYNRILERFRYISTIENPISRELGIYVKIEGVEGKKLPIDRMDISDFKLRCLIEGEKEVAVIFIPESKRNTFKDKIEEYLDPRKDGKKGPRNRGFIDSISNISFADIKSFWTDDAALFPEDNNLPYWWELWLRNKNEDEDEEPKAMAQRLSERIGGKLGNTSLSFFGSTVVLIEASVIQLEQATELISCLEELRLAQKTLTIYLQSPPLRQKEIIDDLIPRLNINNSISTSIVVIDTGVNYNHPLLSKIYNNNYAECWDPSWPKFDNYSTNNEHGSMQAGLGIFGDMVGIIDDPKGININHCVESARILPPMEANDPELYGDITTGTIAKLEIARPEWNRVYSLAITSDSHKKTGQPSSWSGALDNFTSGITDDKRRLFIISTGNNREISASSDYWDQLHLSEIEEPAQSWNALTVGAYTEKTTNDDPSLSGWSPFALAGDISPTSRSSVNWYWKNHAPFKPDVVAEGGNCLISPDRTEVTNAEAISLLTTSGKASGEFFESSSGTSPACAIVSRQAAIIMAEYPDYWPETIRGLIVHSADWTERMWWRFGNLRRQHSQTKAYDIMLRSVGYGVPNLARAQYSANNALTIIVQDELQPFIKEKNIESVDPKLNKMQLYKLPWPTAVLEGLRFDLDVKMRITLSYFIEPNPGRKGNRQRYSYQSHGLRFDVIRPDQSYNNFLASINKLAVSEEYNGPEGDNSGWQFGPKLRTRGSLHSDIWTGSASQLARMNTIAVYPVSGWWKYHTAKERWQKSVRFSLIVSIDIPVDVDIYSVVENQIRTQIEVS